MLKIFLLINIFISSSLIAGTADLSIELEFNEVNGVVYESQGEFVVRVTNLGPDVAAASATFPLPLSILSSVISDNGSFTPEIQFAASSQNNNQNCYFVMVIGSPPPGGGGPTYAYDIDIPSLAVNETIECYGIFSRHFQSGTRNVTWETYNSFDVDPNNNNDSQIITFGIPPKIVPINNIFVLALLFILMIYFGYKSKQI